MLLGIPTQPITDVNKQFKDAFKRLSIDSHHKGHQGRKCQGSMLKALGIADADIDALHNRQNPYTSTPAYYPLLRPEVLKALAGGTDQQDHRLAVPVPYSLIQSLLPAIFISKINDDSADHEKKSA